ncbi:GAF domain-containing protein [Desulfatitalea alkaliphila]|uniref:GAF domain-containing protein n=1 Tax=Desulfatitalea alkaliphila TaxID=2929485 RepID=A0AA41R2L2_9BACT|nr:GAF domain-containing protein [Desulfatitalea alkaliphila]MCJ8501679.1 hypothetical protein [Desulfatitalea alkaliphila]
MNSQKLSPHNFKSELSLGPLLRFWKNRVVPRSTDMARCFEDLEATINANPALCGVLEDPAAIETEKTAVASLMSAAFPAADWDNVIAGAMTPLDHRPFYYTPAFKHLVMNEEGQIKGELKQPELDTDRFLQQRAFWLILDKVYGISHGRNTPVVRAALDPETRLARYFRILPDWQFLEIKTVGKPKPLTQKERRRILDHIDDPDMLAKLIPPQEFIFHGFTLVRAVDVTESEVFLDLARDLIEQETMFCTEGFKRLQDRLQILFGKPDLKAGIGALQGNQVWVVRHNDLSSANCIFRNSNHVSLEELKDSIWLRAVANNALLIVPNLANEKRLCEAEKELLDSGIRAVLIAPLHYQGQIIGTFYVMSPQPDAFSAMDKVLIKPLVPMLSMAVRRGVDDINNIVQTIIKKKCTALHPSVEWRFRKAAFRQLECLQTNEKAEMEPIIFKDVMPLYGQTDIRGSADARTASIQADLLEQLSLALSVVQHAYKIHPWPLVMELQHRIEQRMEGLEQSLQAGTETEIIAFLRKEVEPAFEELGRMGTTVALSVESYWQPVDPRRGFVYRKRKEYEDSIAMLNKRLSAYLDDEEAKAQHSFPHYFEKRQTDGLDYIIYLGAALREDGRFNPFHLQNLALWQLMLACGMAWHTQQVKPSLAVPLETCHLIYYNPTPLSVRFRYDEKRFDVDGAYDVRYEIIRSRLDKATLNGGRERLTQPEHIAVVYSRLQELRDLRKHIQFLQAKGHLSNEMENFTLDDLPGVQGLRALRVKICMDSPTLTREFS